VPNCLQADRTVRVRRAALKMTAGRDRVVQTVVSANAFSIWTYLPVSKLALQTHVR